MFKYLKLFNLSSNVKLIYLNLTEIIDLIMVRISILLVGIALLMSCRKEEKSFNTDLFKDYYYMNLRYRNELTKDTIDTINFYFNNYDTLRITGHKYVTVGGKNKFVDLGVETMKYWVVNNNKIYFNYFSDIFWQTMVSVLPEYEEWRIMELDTLRFSFELYSQGKKCGYCYLLPCKRKLH